MKAHHADVESAAVNVPLIVAGSLAILGAAVHGAAGEVLVLRRLPPETLPATRFGGPVMTRAMIHVTWHVATVAFLTVGAGLLLSGTVLSGDTARGVSLVAAAGATGFAAVALALGAVYTHSPQALYRHPGPAVLTATAALAWWGAL
jgi:hypothetical protein